MPLFGFGRKKERAAGPAPERSRADPRAYADLRSMALGIGADQVGVSPTPELPRVYGVVIDWGLGDSSATFVAIADGTASMYLSSGGGTIGAGTHPAIWHAARDVLAVVERHLDRFSAVPGPGDPDLAHVTYWALTYEGMRTLQHGAGGPPRGDAALQELGDAFQEYVSAFRVESDARGR